LNLRGLTLEYLFQTRINIVANHPNKIYNSGSERKSDFRATNLLSSVLSKE